jgi:RHS repeat-associated protein
VRKNQPLLLSLLSILVCQIGIAQTNAPNGSTRPTATPVTTPSAYSSGIPVNYVRIREALAPISSSAVFDTANYLRVRQTTQYFDGLGRPIQTVVKQASPSLKDMVSPTLYDSFGREQYKYLPYIDTGSNGNFKLDPFGRQATFMGTQYSGESIFYGETRFENSPLNRVTKMLAPGNSWGGSDKGVTQQYQINDASDSVRIWNIANDSLMYTLADTGRNIPSSSGMYGAGQLFENHSADEQNKEVVEYKDKDGKVILKKVKISASPAAGHTGWLCTYYVYDDFGLLRFVIPPKATEYLAAHSWALSTDVINELCYRSEYDGRNRKIANKVPGAGWVYLVYDRRDRLAYSQDANMRSGTQWLATLYDDLNRPATTGMINYSGHRSALQRLLDSHFDAASATTVAVNFYAPDTLYVNTREPGKGIYRAKEKIVFTGDFDSEGGAEYETILGAAVVSTTNILVNYDPFPSSANFVALTVNYYDDYVFTSKTYNTTNISKVDSGGNAYPDSLPTITNVMTRGLLTGTRVRAIENPADLTVGGWIETVQFYDNKERIVQTQSDNYKNGIDVVTTRYDFTGHPITTYSVHNNAAAGQTVKTKTNNLFDNAGRLLRVSETLNDDNNTSRFLARNSYDELGQLVQKREGQKGQGDTTAMEVLDNTYNIRGWLQGINKDYTNGSGSRWFGMELNYDYGFASNQYNGNIAGSQWRSKSDGERRAMGYSYDAANRILAGDFNQYTSGSWNKNAGLDFSLTSMSYDPNGNILKMSQKGWKLSGSDLIDSLLYTYNPNSNKLLNVIDNQNDTATKLGDFRSSKAYMTALSNSKTNSAIDYTYDDNGNLVKDRNKDIGTSATDGIIYNHMNLPYKISAIGKGTTTFIYDAAGNKLEKRTYDSTTSRTTKTTYLRGYVYRNDTLQLLAHEEGRIRKKPDNSFVYDYFIKDHLGNVRMTLTEEYQQDTYPVATLETGATGVEAEYFAINTGAIFTNPAALPSTYTNNNGNPPYNSNPNSVVTATSAKMYKLNAATGDSTGLGFAIKVMTGDTVSIFGKSFWHSSGSVSNSHPTAANDLLAALAGASVVANAGKGATSGALAGSSSIPSQVSNILSSAPNVSGRPKAYINWILFDERFKPDSITSGFDAVDNTADVLKTHTQTININKSGILYVWVSNASNQDVYFDNVQLIHNRGPLLEENHYYPYGLLIAGISSKAAGKLENRIKYNGMELQSNEFSDGSGLELYDFDKRLYDQQLGIMRNIDPLSEMGRRWSPFVYAFDNPIRFIDPDGMWAFDANGNATTNDPEEIAYVMESLRKDKKDEKTEEKKDEGKDAEGPGDRVQAARNMLGIPYKQQTGTDDRTATTADALKYMDCSEYVARVLAADGITKGVQSMDTKELKRILSDETKFIHSEKEPKVGDIALWEGHTGIVTGVEPGGKIKLAHERGVGKDSKENGYAVLPGVYKPGAVFYGYYRPKQETPDGKVAPIKP